MRLSYFNNRHDNEPKPLDVTWERFCAAVQSPKVRAEKDGALFAPVTFRGSRAKQNVTEVSMLVLDFDHGTTVNEEWAIIRESGYTAALYTTHSHQRSTTDHPELRDAFRICIPLTAPIPADKYPLLWNWAYELTGGKIDRAARDASRMFYTPVKASDDAPYEWRIQDGELLAWESLNLREAEPAPVHTSVHADSRSPYIQRAFDAEISLVVNAANGLRNDQLNKSAFALGQFVGSGALPESEVVGALERAAKGIGLTGSEIPGTIRSGISAGRQTPRTVPESQYSNPVQVLSEKVSQTPSTVARGVEELLVADIGDSADRMIQFRHDRHAMELIHTGWDALDAIYSPIKGALTLIVGNPNAGKSGWADNLMVNIYRKYGWKFAIVSFETQPIWLHQCVIISLLAGKPYSLHRDNHLTDDEIIYWCEKIKGHFFFHTIPYEVRTIENVLALVRETHAKQPFDALLIDPFSELKLSAITRGTPLEILQNALSAIRAFTYTTQIHCWVICHPTKEPPEARGKRTDRVIDLHDISGGRLFENCADVGLTVHRHNKGESGDHTEIYVNKVRREFPGRLGSVKFDYIQPIGAYDVRSGVGEYKTEYDDKRRYGKDY